MARKRGGLAGLYDRNKGFFKTAVPAALSFIPGAGLPLAAAAGAAFGGFDRPGKAGIGFDPVKGIMGGLQGAAIGTGTQGARALLTGGGPMAGMMGGGSAGAGMPGGAVTPASAPDVVGKMSDESLRNLLAPKPSMLSRAGSFATQNKDLIAMAGRGIQGALPQPGQEAAMMNAETQRMLAEEQIAEAERERERRRRIAELLMPYAQGVYGSMNSRMNG